MSRTNTPSHSDSPVLVASWSFSSWCLAPQLVFDPSIILSPTAWLNLGATLLSRSHTSLSLPLNSSMQLGALLGRHHGGWSLRFMINALHSKPAHSGPKRTALRLVDLHSGS